MNFPMRVHNVSTHPVEVDVVFNGEHARASLPELHVELLSADGTHGSQLLRFRSAADITDAKKLFKLGGTVMMTVGPAGPEKLKTEAEHTEAAPAD